MANDKKPAAAAKGTGSTLFLKSKDTHIINGTGDNIKILREPQTKQQTASNDPGKILGIVLQFADHKYELDNKTEEGQVDIQKVAEFFGVELE